MKITGAEIIVECLIEEGVDTVFGYPGGQVIPLYDALYKGPVALVLRRIAKRLHDLIMIDEIIRYH